jgi:hypothetical protein
LYTQGCVIRFQGWNSRFIYFRLKLRYTQVEVMLLEPSAITSVEFSERGVWSWGGTY